MTYNIGYKVHWASNDTWSGLRFVTQDSSGYNYYPTLITDSKDNVHIAWYSNTGTAASYYNIHYRMWDSTTGLWKPIEYVTAYTDYPYQYYPSIGVNQKDEIDLVWHGYQMPGYISPYCVRHAQKVGNTWSEDENLFIGTSYQYYPNIFSSPPNSIAKSGYAIVWNDGGSAWKYWASEDFQFGNPEFTDGLDECKYEIRVHNVEPKLDPSRTYTLPNVVKEQEEFIFHAEFEDPAAGISTEIFEYNLTWGNGDYTGWKEVELFKEGKPAGLTELDLQPDATEGKDTCAYGYSSYLDYNMGIYQYSYMGYSGSYGYRSFIEEKQTHTDRFSTFCPQINSVSHKCDRL